MTTLMNWNIETICYRHVQVNNEGAIDFYKKFGFEIVETKEHYYKRIDPADAHVLQKTIRKNNQVNGSLDWNFVNAIHTFVNAV